MTKKYHARYRNAQGQEVEFMDSVVAENDQEAIDRLIHPEYFLLKITTDSGRVVLEKI